MTIKDSLKKFFIEEPKVGTVSESKEIDTNLPKINIKNKNLLYWLGLIPVFFIALYIRTRNLPLLQGKYLIELDTYFFFRYAKMLLEQGTVPVWDYMRYVPTGLPTAPILFFPKTMVFFYKIAHFFFSNLSQIEWHIIYPPVITAISLIFFFLFVKELLGHRAAFISTAFLAVIPAYLQRTMAGFADHEAVAMLWIFISLWLFVLAWKSENWKRFIPLSAISGLFAGAMAATWGGYALVVMSIALFALASTILTNNCKKPFLRFLPWSIMYVASGTYFWMQPFVDFAKLLPNLIILFTISFLMIHLILQCIPKLKEFKIPLPAISLLLTISALLTTNLLVDFADLKEFLIALTKEGSNRVFS